MSIEYHLYLAKKTIKYVRSIISGSSTEDTSWKRNWFFKEINEVRAGLDPIIEEKGKGLTSCHRFIFEDYFKDLMRGKIALCGELSLLAFEYLVKRYPVSIDICHLAFGDHVFLVIGRPPNSDKENIKTWEDAIICDPWANLAYPAKQFDEIKKLKSVKLHPSIYSHYPYPESDYHYLYGSLEIIHSEKPMKRSASNLKRAGDLFFSVKDKKAKDDNFLPIYSEKAFFTRRELAAKRKLTQDSVVTCQFLP